MSLVHVEPVNYLKNHRLQSGTEKSYTRLYRIHVAGTVGFKSTDTRLIDRWAEERLRAGFGPRAGPQAPSSTPSSAVAEIGMTQFILELTKSLSLVTTLQIKPENLLRIETEVFFFVQPHGL
uniref:Non-specific serine/threonine protein kinase n=1 Tax=Steinernema glaseri TaxID=37863 RepID=A0A1I7YVI1_9BILA